MPASATPTAADVSQPGAVSGTGGPAGSKRTRPPNVVYTPTAIVISASTHNGSSMVTGGSCACGVSLTWAPSTTTSLCSAAWATRGGVAAVRACTDTACATTAGAGPKNARKTTRNM